MRTRAMSTAAALAAVLLTATLLSPSAGAGPVGPFDEAEGRPGQWTWIDVPTMLSRTNVQSGIGVRLQPTSDDLHIHLQGGGACFNAITCAGNPSQFTEANFAAYEAGNAGNSSQFSDSPPNPLAQWNRVFVPYITGDVHSGTNPLGDVGVGLLQRFMGAQNVTEMLALAAPYFNAIPGGIDRVVLTGTSAGGFGTLSNYPQVADAFPTVDVGLIDDVGPIVFDADVYPACLHAQWDGAWDLTVPADLATHTSGTYDHPSQAAYEYATTKYPDARFGLVSSLEDNTIRRYYGYGADNCTNSTSVPTAAFAGAMRRVAGRFGAFAGWNAFLVEGGQHGLFYRIEDGGTFTEFVAAVVDDAPAPHWFTDMPQWLETAGDWVADRGVMTGYNDATFQPNQSISRAQIANAAYRSAGSPDVTGLPQPFSDVPPWVDPAVRWAADGNLVTGFPGALFQPDDPASRAQAVRLLYRYAGSPDVSVLPPHGFADVPPWVEDAVRWAAADPGGGLEPVITGYPDNTFRPDLDVSRGQWARMLQRTDAQMDP